jgi:hypothetical protein
VAYFEVLSWDFFNRLTNIGELSIRIVGNLFRDSNLVSLERENTPTRSVILSGFSDMEHRL